jgi:hypothetical protein
MVKYSTAELFRLWHDNSLRTIEVANQLVVSQVFLYTLARRHHLPKRNGPRGGFKPPRPKVVNDPDPEPSDDQLAGDSLALSPWVAQRAEMFRREKEQKGEPDRVEIAVTRFTLTGPRRRMARYA